VPPIRFVYGANLLKTLSLLTIFLGIHFGATSFAQQSPTSPRLPTPQTSSLQSQQQEDEDVVRITTNLVQVDAVVTDKNGKPVVDLKPEEVRIFEDGKPQKITFFSFIPAAADQTQGPKKPPSADRIAPPPTNLRPTDVRRTIALVVDDLGLSFESTHFVRRALKKFVDDEMQPNDLVAIIRTSGGAGALQQFTSDRRLLYAAIERVKWYAGGRSGVSAFAPIEPPKFGRYSTFIESKDTELSRLREDMFAVGTLGAISYVVRGLRELPGRKSILVISDGIRFFDTDDPGRFNRVVQKLQQLIDQANRAAVVIYTLNATGIQTMSLTASDWLADSGTVTGAKEPQDIEELLSDRRGESFAKQGGLDSLAEKTGGIAIRSTNDLSGGIRRVMNDQKGYYLIGYRPDEATFDARAGRRLFHKLRLQVARSGKYNVRMRSGFFGVADAEAGSPTRTPRDQIVNALVSPFSASGVHMQLTSLFADEPKLGPLTRSFLYVDAKDLTFTEGADGWHTATFDMVAMTFDTSGNVVDQISRTDTLRLRGEGYKLALQDGFVYSMIFPVKKPGVYQFRAVLRDHDSARVGSASQLIEIPDLKKNRLALSGIVVNATDPSEFRKIADGASVRSPQDGAQNNSQPGLSTASSTQTASGQKGGDAQQPSPQASEAVRHFRTGMTMRYGLVIYNARFDKASGLPQLQIQTRLFRGGQPVFTGKVQPLILNNPPDLRRLAAAGAIKLGADLVPGEYILQVIVSDLLADEKHRTSTQWMDFEIVK